MMYPQVILVGGKKRTGKNTAKDIISSYLKQKRFNVVEESFAKVIKDITCELLEISHEALDYLKNSGGFVESVTEESGHVSTVTHRQFLQVLGTDIRDKYFDKYLWVDMFLSRVKNYSNDTFIIVDDWRFPHEYERVRMSFEVLPIIIKRALKLEEDLHPSETALDDFVVPDLKIVDNNSTIGDLRNTLQKIIDEKLIKG